MRNPKVFACLLAAFATPLFASVDQGLLGLVPADSKIVIGVDAQRAKTSNLGQFVLDRHTRPTGDFQSFVEQTGFDPRRDLQYFLLATTGAGDHTPGVVLARGLFDVDRIETAAKSKGGVVESFAGTDLISVKDKDGTNAIAFPETGVAVAGSLSMVRGVLSGRATPTSLDPALTALIASADGNDVWFASTVSAASFGSHMSSPGNSGPMANAQVFRSVREASGGIRLGETVQLTFDAITRSPEDANALADVVRFASNMIQTKAQNDPHAAALAPAFQQMQLESSGSNVHIAMAMPEKTLEQMQPLAMHLGR